MSFNSFPFNFPTAALPLVDNQGKPTNFFWQYLLSLFNRTGSADGIDPQVVPSPLTAAGTSQATALALGADWNWIGTVPVGTGAVIPAMKPGNDIWVWNAGANPLNVFPFSGAQIGSAGTINAAVALAAGHLAYFQCWSPTLLLKIIDTVP
jgi:hypothetical protein